MTIRAVLIINNHGKPRLTKFYAQLPPARQQALIHRIYKLVSKRPDTVCNFLDTPELTPLLPPDNIIAPANAASGASASSKKKREADSQTGSQRTAEDELRVIYRHYATLYFVFVVDQSESELGILDLIQVFVESLDRCFENVCELDLIFHFDEVHAILSEVVQGGLVLETNINEIVVAAQATSRARRASASSSSGRSGAASYGPAALNLSLPSFASPASPEPGSPDWGAGAPRRNGGAAGVGAEVLGALQSMNVPAWARDWQSRFGR